MEYSFDFDTVLPRFNRLIQDVVRGDWRRNSFEMWEIELMLDIQACSAEIATRRDLLPRYQKAVQRQLSRRREMPMKLSEYVDSLRVRQASRMVPRETPESDLASALS